MVKRIFAVALTALLCFSCEKESPSPITPPPAAKTELEGVWTGSKTGESEFLLSFTFKNNTVTVTKDAAAFFNGTFTVDTTSDPKKIDIKISSHTTTAFNGKTIAAAYRLNMNILAITANDPETPRPDLYGTNYELGQ